MLSQLGRQSKSRHFLKRKKRDALTEFEPTIYDTPSVDL